MTILSQGKSPEGVIQPWANEKIGLTNNLIHARGDQLTLLAEILGNTPSDVNESLKEIQGFRDDQIIWEMLLVAYPGWSAQVITPYNNDFVLDALSKGQFVIVVTDTQSVRYMGGGVCHDPKTGTERLTSDFPNVQSFIVITHTPEPVREEKRVEEKPHLVGGLEDLSENVPLSVTSPKNEDDELRDKIDGLTQKEKNSVKKYLKQMHVANLAIKKLLNL